MNIDQQSVSLWGNIMRFGDICVSFFYTNHINQQYLHADEEIAYTRFVCLNLTRTEPMELQRPDERMNAVLSCVG